MTQEQEAFLERLKTIPRPMASFRDYLAIAGEEIAATEVNGRYGEVTIYGASPEAQARLEEHRQLGQLIVYKPMSEAEALGLKPGECRTLSG